MRERKLSPSILAADLWNLKREVQAVEEAGAEYLHIDIMDGWFVPSLSFGLPTVSAIRRNTKMVLDVHLMVEEPDRYLEEFARAGADILTVHAEACTHLDRVLHEIRRMGLKTGIALNPGTPLSALDWVLGEVDMVLLMTVNPGFGGQSFIPYMPEKIRALRRLLEERGSEADIEVDGGITPDNLDEVLEAGANVIVAGSAVFRGDAAENVRRFHAQMNQTGVR